IISLMKRFNEVNSYDTKGKNDEVKHNDSGYPELSNLGNMDIQTVMAIAGFCRLSALSSMNDILKKEVDRAASVQSSIRDKRVALYQKQIAKSIEAENKAKTSSIFSVLVDWIVAGAEVVYGCIKLASALDGDPTAAAAGLSYLAAGIFGVVKSAAETLTLTLGDSPTLQKISDITGWLQKTAEGLATTLDLFCAGKLAMAARSAVNAGVKGVSQASIEELAALVKTTSSALVESTDATAATIESVSHKIAEEITEQICRDVSNKAINEGAADVMEMVSKNVETDAIEQIADKEELYAQARKVLMESCGEKLGEPSNLNSIIKNSVSDVIKNVIKEITKKGVDIETERLLSEVMAQVKKRVFMRIAAHITAEYLNSTFQKIRIAFPLGKSISTGISGIETSVDTAEISRLQRDQNYEEFMMNWLDVQCKSYSLNRIKNNINDISDTSNRMSDLRSSSYLLSINIAGSIV
ncbi:MAG: type III secretion system translocon subunit SctE, partial [Plesiomonas sp.]